MIHHGNCSLLLGTLAVVKPVSPERGREWRKGRNMDREIKEQKYEDYITTVTRQATAVGRREPYHLTYLKKYSERSRPGPEERQRERNMGKETVAYDQDCM